MNFEKLVHALDDSLAGAVLLIVPAAALFIVAWLREKYLATKARAAAIEARLAAPAQDEDSLIDSALDRIDLHRSFRPNDKRLREIIRRESRKSDRPPPKKE